MLDDLAAGTPVGVAPLGDRVVLAWDGGSAVVDAGSLTGRPDLRWVWWSAPDLVATGVRPRACWDLGAVGSLAYGTRRTDPAAVWAAAHGRPEPAPARGGEPDLFSVGADDPVGADGLLADGWTVQDEGSARRWAALALEVRALQASALEGRRTLLTAYAESAAALLCRELAHDGLPVDGAVAAELLTGIVGPPDGPGPQPPPSLADTGADLRSPEQVRALLSRLGIDVPDTRSWRLEPYSATSPEVAALLAWRKADRVATTYGWRWLAERVRGGRLRGEWQVADGGAGRMTAGAGLHNLPAELRPAVRAEPGHVFVGADLGQVEPRVLAVVSGDPAFAAAAGADDLYAPVAASLGVDRPTAKVAVLAAMYGQTSGVAGSALRDMDRVYGRAMAYLRAAEQVGRDGGELRTYGGRRLTFARAADETDAQTLGRGRYARNAMVQGAAAELFKAWAATVRAGLAPLGAEIALCLHDELLLHVPEAQSAAAQALLADALQQTVRWWAAGSPVRFVADVRAGASWPDVH